MKRHDYGGIWAVGRRDTRDLIAGRSHHVSTCGVPLLDYCGPGQPGQAGFGVHPCENLVQARQILMRVRSVSGDGGGDVSRQAALHFFACIRHTCGYGGSMPQVARADELAASAFTLFSSRGIAGVTMDAIAADASVTKGCLYWHYKSKDELVQAACRHYYQNWHRMSQRSISTVADPVERLKVVVRASVHSCLIDESNRVFTLEILTLSLYDKAVRDGWRQFFEAVRIFYISLAESAAGSLAVDHCESAVDTMLSAMEGYKLRAVFEPALCSKSAEAEITGQLLRILGIPR